MKEDLNLSYDSQTAILYNTLTNDSFLMVNTKLCHELTVVPTVLISLLMSRQKYFEKIGKLKMFPKANAPKGAKFFYATYDNLRAQLNLGYRAQSNAIDILEKKEFIFCHRAGLPAVKYYSINPKKILEALSTLSSVSIDETAELDYAETAELDNTKSKTNNIKDNNIKVNKNNLIKENKNKEIFNEDLELEFDLASDLASEPKTEDSFLLRDDKLHEPKISVGEETMLGANSPEFAYAIKDENGKVIKHSNNPYKILPKEEADLTKGFVSDLINDYYPIDEMYLPIQDNAANERFRAKYPPLYPEFGNHMNIYQSCLRDCPKNEAKAQVLFEQLYPEKIDWSRVRSKQGVLPMKKEEIDKDFLANMDYSTSATLLYFGIKYEKTGQNKERPVMKYKEVWVPIYPYSYLEKQAPTRLKAFLSTASNVPSYYQVLVDLIKDKEKK